MPNINVRKKIEELSNEMDRLLEHVVQHSGVSAREAVFVDNVATSLCEGAAQLAAYEDDVRDAARKIEMSASTSFDSWAGLKYALQTRDLRRAARAEKQALRDYQTMLKKIRAYQTILADEVSS